MYRSLYFKIILIFVVFIITVMAVVGTVLLSSVYRFYTDEFSDQMEALLSEGANLRSELSAAMSFSESLVLQKQILLAYSSNLGIDDYRNFYILDISGNFLDGSDKELGENIVKTSNLLRAMSGKDGIRQEIGSGYTDYAIYLTGGAEERIIYIKDTQEEMKALSWELFSLILQSILVGLLIAMILSFFLAKAITAPIQSLTRGAQLIAAGEFTVDSEIENHAKDEIGTLTATFNSMKTALKNTLDEVSGERQKLETIFSYLKDGVIAFSDKGGIIHINKTAIDYFKGSLGESSLVEALTFDSMISTLDIEYAKKHIGGLKNQKSYVLRDVELGDRVFDINFARLVYIENNRRHRGCIVVFHDITARYELEKARREFVANVSHELRTPLTSIKGANETILMNPDMPAEFRDNFLNMAIEESDRMLRIIGDLLTLSRLDNNRTKWKIEEFSVNKLLSKLCDVIRVEAESKGHKILLKECPDIAGVTGDCERIEQVVLNILSNAVKYTKENGTISVTAEHDQKNVYIKIKDNGIGIPKADISRLFERFYRVEKARTSDTGGTGLGLAIAKEIVTAHGGDITIESELNVGTEVTISLPFKTKLENSAD